MADAETAGFTPVKYIVNDSEGHTAGEEKGNAKTKTKNAPLDPAHAAYLAAAPGNKPLNNWVGEIYDGCTLKKITNLATNITSCGVPFSVWKKFVGLARRR